MREMRTERNTLLSILGLIAFIGFHRALIGQARILILADPRGKKQPSFAIGRLTFLHTQGARSESRNG